MCEKLIKKLIKGKPLTGEELGRIVLYAGAKDIETQSQGITIDLPRTEIQERINNFSNADELEFSKYIGVNNFIRYAYLSCLVHKEIARNRFNAIATSLADVSTHANRIRHLNTNPLVFTEKQLADMYKEAETFFSSWEYDVIDVICAYIGYQIDLRETGEADAKFNKILEAYKNIEVPDDLKEVINIIWADYEQYNINDAPFPLKTKEELINSLRYRNIKPLTKCPEKELKQPLTYQYIKKVTPKEHLKEIKVTKHTGEADKIKTLYNFLDNITFKDVHKLKASDVSLKGLLEKHFKDLYIHSLKEIQKINGLEVFAKGDLNATISLPELAKADVFTYKDIYEDKIAERYGYKYRGLTVLSKLSNINPQYLDEKGHFKFGITPTSYDDLADFIHHFHEYRIDNAPLYTSHMQWAIAFNIIIDLMCEIYEMKELAAYKIRIVDIGNIIEDINSRIKHLLLYDLMPFNMGVVTDVEDKLHTIREEFLEIFPFIDNNFFKPTTENVENVKDFIKDKRNFVTLSPGLVPLHILFGARGQNA